MIRLPLNDPKAMALSSAAALAAWKASNFSIDPAHLMEVATAALAGGAVPHNPTSDPGISEESHIITPYQNNLEE
jgi:hypothetical protein